MEQFSKHFDTLQAAILSTEVDDNVGQICQCHHEAALYRCMDCLFPVSCGRCIVASHATNPFHHIQKWNGFFFGKTTLSELGQVVGLGHDGGLCPNRLLESKGRVTTVVHVNGIHQVRIEFCHCHKAPAEPEQLAKASLFPATVDRPATAFTFEVLKQFDILSLTFKIPAYDFVNALVNMTNSAFPDKVPVSFFSPSLPQLMTNGNVGPLSRVSSCGACMASPCNSSPKWANGQNGRCYRSSSLRAWFQREP